MPRNWKFGLPDLRTRYHIVSLGILGSYVRGEQRKTADLEASPKP